MHRQFGIGVTPCVGDRMIDLVRRARVQRPEAIERARQVDDRAVVAGHCDAGVERSPLEMTDDHVEGAVPRMTASRLRRALVVEAPGDIA